MGLECILERLAGGGVDVLAAWRHLVLITSDARDCFGDAVWHFSNIRFTI
jgi:hypothetical protein